MKEWDDTTLSVRQRLCWWLETIETDFTTEMARDALNLPKDKWKKTDQISSEISILCAEEKIQRMEFINGRTRIYKKVEGLDFDDLYPRSTRKKFIRERPVIQQTYPRGINGITVHKLGW